MAADHRRSKNQKLLNYQLFLQRENLFFHQPYTNELSFYSAVQEGNLEYIAQMKKQFAGAEESGKGTLSKNPVRNERYHFIVNTALITRNCIEGGLPQETAYTLSDIYIQKADVINDVETLRNLNDEMVWEFATQMNLLRTEKIISPHISKCIHYIYDHLHTKLTIQELSLHTGLNASYLSTLFKKETGSSIHAFIQDTRLKTAASMLINTDYSCSNISHTLCFSSQSHFTGLFRKKYGMTPANYRKNHAIN